MLAGPWCCLPGVWLVRLSPPRARLCPATACVYMYAGSLFLSLLLFDPNLEISAFYWEGFIKRPFPTT